MKVVAVATTHPAEALGEADRVLPGFGEAPGPEWFPGAP